MDIPELTAVRRPESPALVPLISALGIYRGRHMQARERALPTGHAQLLVNLAADELWSHPDGERQGRHTPGAALLGAATRPAVIDTAHQRAVLWVAFRPGGAYPFFDLPASAVHGLLVPLVDLWGRDGATLRERLLASSSAAGMLRVVEAVLLARAVRPLEPDPAVRLAAAALHRGATVAAVSDRLGWTSRRLARQFADRVGPTPKRYARVRRLQRLIGSANAGGGGPGREAGPGRLTAGSAGATPAGGREVDWARLAAECGYHDQAHMIHEFQALAAVSPTQYAPRSAGEQNHTVLAADFYNPAAAVRATMRV